MIVKQISVLIFACCSSSIICYSQAQEELFCDFKKADSVSNIFIWSNLQNLPLLSYNLTHDLSSDVEKFRAIYKWVCQNITYDYPTFVKNQHKRKKLKNENLEQWNAKLNKKVFRNLIKEKKTICWGYAYLVKELSTLAGIQCEIIDGYGRSTQANIGGKGIINHSWNAVKLNDKWYLCDPTWSSGYFDLNANRFVSKFQEGYFLASPELFIKSHYPAKIEWTLLTQNISLSEFLQAPIFYHGGYDYKVKHLFPTQFEIFTNKSELISWRFHLPEKLDIKTISIVSDESGSQKETYVDFKREGQDILISHRFSSKGKKIVHLKINEAFVASYKVVIK